MNWKNDANKRAITILRVSSTGQKDNHSHETQEKEVKYYCKRNDLKLLKVFKIVESAKDSSKRIKYHEAINFALENGIRHIIFYQSDREGRNTSDFERNESLIRADRIVIHYAKDSKVFHKFSSDSDFFMRDIAAATNKQYSRTLSTKVRDALTTKAEKGWYPGNHTPLGYRHQKLRDEDGRELRRGSVIVPDPDCRKVAQVRREFELRAAGLSYAAIRKQIIDEEMLSSKEVKKYHKSTIEKRLKNKFYSGLFDWNDIEYQGKHELIIDPEILSKVQRSFSKRGRNPRFKSGPFSDFMTCKDSDCGRLIVFDPKKKKIKSTGEVKTYNYYRCSNSRGVHRSMKGMNVAEETLWEQFQEPVNAISIERDFGELVLEELDKIHKKAKDARKAELEEFKVGLRDLDKEEDLVYDNFAKKILDEAGYRRQVKRIRDKRFMYTEFLEKAQDEISDEFMKVARRLIELAINAKTLYESHSAEERIELLKNICSNRVLDGRRAEYHLRSSLAVLVDMKENKEWRRGRDSNSRYDR